MISRKGRLGALECSLASAVAEEAMIERFAQEMAYWRSCGVEEVHYRKHYVAKFWCLSIRAELGERLSRREREDWGMLTPRPAASLP